MQEDHPTDNIVFGVKDPKSTLPDCPAMTTMMYRVCGNDEAKFDEAMRLVGLFMVAAYDKGRRDASPSRDATPPSNEDALETTETSTGREGILKNLLGNKILQAVLFYVWMFLLLYVVLNSPAFDKVRKESAAQQTQECANKPHDQGASHGQ